MKNFGVGLNFNKNVFKLMNSELLFTIVYF